MRPALVATLAAAGALGLGIAVNAVVPAPIALVPVIVGTAAAFVLYMAVVDGPARCARRPCAPS